MICTHLTENDCIQKVPREMAKKKEEMERLNLFINPNSNRVRCSDMENLKTFCYECDNCGKSYICLHCGFILCGRDDLGHALDHFEDVDHSVVMDCITYEIYCYECDDFVHLDFELPIKQLINSLKVLFDRVDFIDGSDSEGSDKNNVKETNGIVSVQTIAHSLEAVNIHNSKKRLSKKERKELKKKGISKGKANVIMPEEHVTSEKPAPSRGLKNLGNTCFMNAALQSLGCVDDFQEHILRLPSISELLESKQTSKNGYQSCLADEYKKLCSQLAAKHFRDPVNPAEFREAFISKCPRFRGYRQHDSHEFMRYLLDELHTELKKCVLNDYEKDTSPVSDLFEGILQSRVICLTCKHRSTKNDVFFDLSLDIPKSKRPHIADSLKTFFDKEILDKADKYECSKCKTKQVSSKQMFIKSLPEVLCLQIKRFRENGMKADTLVEFPSTDLNLDKYLTEDSNDTNMVYELTSLIVHIGYGCGSGHYIAFGRRGPNWYQFDDQHVKPCTEETVLKQRAYVLFYKKRVNL